MKITLKAKTTAKVKPSVIGFIKILLGKPVEIEIDFKDVPVVFNDD